MFMTVERHNAVAEYAEANDLLFYDFNEKALYEQNGFDYPTDMHNMSMYGKTFSYIMRQICGNTCSC